MFNACRIARRHLWMRRGVNRNPAVSRSRFCTCPLLAGARGTTALCWVLLASPLHGQIPDGGVRSGCPAERVAVENSVLEGTVRDAITGVALPGARVEVAPGGDAGARELAAWETETGPDGRYRLCGLPGELRAVVRALVAGRTSEPVEVELAADHVTSRDLVVPLGSPEAGRIVGWVADLKTGRPVTAAAVTLEAGGADRAAVSDGGGRFLLDNVAAGEHLLGVSHLGYARAMKSISVAANRTLEVRIQLVPEAIELEPIVVSLVRNPRLEMHGFYERKEWGDKLGLGHFFTREDIERRNPLRIAHLVADVPGVRLLCSRGRHCHIRLARSPPRCRIADVYVDGILAVDHEKPWKSTPIDNLVLPVEVAGVEVYKGSASLPAEFGGARGECGAVLIWTRGGW